MSKDYCYSTLLFLTLVTFPSFGASTDKLDSERAAQYNKAQLKNKILSHANKPQRKKKINNLFPLGHIDKPSLNGNFSRLQQYEAATKRIKTRAISQADG